MGKAIGVKKGKTAAGQKSGRVVKSVDRASKPSSKKSGKAYKSTKLGKMC